MPPFEFEDQAHQVSSSGWCEVARNERACSTSSIICEIARRYLRECLSLALRLIALEAPVLISSTCRSWLVLDERGPEDRADGGRHAPARSLVLKTIHDGDIDAAKSTVHSRNRYPSWRFCNADSLCPWWWRRRSWRWGRPYGRLRRRPFRRWPLWWGRTLWWRKRRRHSLRRRRGPCSRRPRP